MKNSDPAIKNSDPAMKNSDPAIKNSKRSLIIQNGQTVMIAPGEGNPSCAIIFNNLPGANFSREEQRQYKSYLAMMFHDFPKLTYGEIELWEDGKFKQKGYINK